MPKPMTAAILLSVVLAAPALADAPLPPGRPSGAGKAQLDSNQVTFVALGGLVAGVGLYLAAGEYRIAGGGGVVVPPTTTTSTTTGTP